MITNGLKAKSAASWHHGRRLFSLLWLCLAVGAQAQMVERHPVQLQWNGIGKEVYGSDTLYYIALESAQLDGAMPVFVKSIPIFDDHVDVKVKLQEIKAATLSDEELKIAEGNSYGPDFLVDAMPLRSRDEVLLSVRIVPFRQQGSDASVIVMPYGGSTLPVESAS